MNENGTFRPHWEQYTEEFNSFKDVLQSYYDITTEGGNPKNVKDADKLIAQYNKLAKAHNSLDKLIEPVVPIQVKSRIQDKNFLDKWQYYKEYLIESHGKYMKTREEQARLNQLITISSVNGFKAIQYLDYFMANGYKTIFIPSDKQLEGQEVDVTAENKTEKGNKYEF